jgi:hypothetical protein
MQFRSMLNGTKSGQSARWTFRAAPATCRARPVPAYERLGVSVVDSPALWGLRRPVDRAPHPAKPQTGPTCAVRHVARRRQHDPTTPSSCRPAVAPARSACAGSPPGRQIAGTSPSFASRPEPAARCPLCRALLRRCRASCPASNQRRSALFPSSSGSLLPRRLRTASRVPGRAGAGPGAQQRPV